MTGMILDTNDQFTSVGKIRKAHGIRGELFLISFSKNFDWLEDVKEANLVKKVANEKGELEEVRFSFDIKKAKSHKVGRILKLEGINDRNRAEEFEGASFQVPSSLFEKESEETYYLLQLKGFQLFDSQENLRGEVIGFANNTVQDLLVVKSLDKEFEVPYVEELIVRVDFTTKQIVMNLPEGIDEN